MSTREQQAVRYWPTTKTYVTLGSTPPAHYNPPPPLEAPAPTCPNCGGLGEIQVGWERETNSAITRTCSSCAGHGLEAS